MESHDIALALAGLPVFHLSVRHFGTSSEMYGHFDTITVVPKCLRSEVSWHQIYNLEADYMYLAKALGQVTHRENNLLVCTICRQKDYVSRT